MSARNCCRQASLPAINEEWRDCLHIFAVLFINTVPLFAGHVIVPAVTFDPRSLEESVRITSCARIGGANFFSVWSSEKYKLKDQIWTVYKTLVPTQTIKKMVKCLPNSRMWNSTHSRISSVECYTYSTQLTPTLSCTDLIKSITLFIK